MTSLARSALLGVTSNFGGSAVLVLAQIGSTAATARLVAPQEFGIYAVAQACTSLAGYFTMNAIGTGVLRRPELGPKTVGTAMTLSLASAAVLTMVVSAGASLWAHAWGVPAAVDVIRVVAIALFLTAVATVPTSLIRRRLRFGTATVVETGSQVIGLVVGVALALDLHSAIALATGQAVGAAVLLVGAVALVVDELRLGFDRGDARDLFTFASQVSGLGFGSYVTNTAPSWFAARMFGPVALGIYSRASLMISLPLTYTASSLTKVLYPLYGRVRSDLARTKTLLDEGLTLTTGLAWPAFALIGGGAPVMVRLLLGSRWHGAALFVTLFALGACANLPCSLLTNAAEAFGWMRLIMMRQLMFFSAIAVTLLATYLGHVSLRWLLVGIAASEWIAYALTLHAFVHRGFLNAGLTLRSQAVQGAVAAATCAIATLAMQACAGEDLIIQAGGQFAVGSMLVGAVLIGRGSFPATKILNRRLTALRDEFAASAGAPAA